MTRVKRILLWGTFSAAAMVGSGLLLADQLTPAANGAPSHALPLSTDQTALDRELVPLLARNPGKTGALMLTDGIDAFAARAMSARQAGRSLDLQYYIWHDDLTGRLLAREAWLAAERGVRVRLLLDDISAGGKDGQLMLLDSHAGIEVRVYNPFRNRDGISRLLEMLQRVFSLNHRMHNKAWIADGRVAVVGGRNIGLEYFSASDDANFHDLDLLLFGPAVADADAIFDAFWNSDAAVPLAGLNKRRDFDAPAILAAIGGEAETAAARRYLERVESSPTVRAYVEQELAPYWSEHIEVVSDPPLKHAGDDQRGWLVHRIDAALRDARQAALLISPYFVPGDAITAQLTGLAAGGVHVGVVTNSLAANDVAAVHGGYSKYRKPLLAGGVHLYELRHEAAGAGDAGDADAGKDHPRATASRGSGFGGSGSARGSGASLHTKAFLIDRSHGFIGSYNLDPRSAWLNTEMGVFFDHAGLADALRAEYLHLASPALSYRVWLDPTDKLRWLDRSVEPPRVHDREPEAGAWRRAQAAVMRWLPIESQL
ncbi:phospholipase D family protein [Luteimonas sp. MC1828]|uniref:phospholipase D family protein n=1 Tax=Luteimonas sp. MC1828 TaxID=2799787 RepID=UPI0018F258EE|nr:phospholipase D family protein [Luteimonas sp. MC1828]MBJ7573805.1 phospholipase D family protein [Luteimonas sp. MC1828]